MKLEKVNWTKLQELALAESDVRWEMADWLLSQFNKVSESRQRFCEEAEKHCGLSSKTLANRIHTATQWPSKKRRSSASYSMHDLLSGHKDRFDLIKVFDTYREVRRYLFPDEEEGGEIWGPPDLNAFLRSTEDYMKKDWAYWLDKLPDGQVTDNSEDLSDVLRELSRITRVLRRRLKQQRGGIPIS